MAIDLNQVQVSLLLDPVEGWPGGAWWFRYGRDSFITDKGGGNQAPFAHKGEACQPIYGSARTAAPLEPFDLMTYADIATAKNLSTSALDSFANTDPGFPRPVVRFRDGPVWSKEAIRRWVPTAKDEL
jgi:hypothetical protein